MTPPRNFYDVERRIRATIDTSFPEGHLDIKPVINYSPRYELYKEYWDQILFLSRSVQTRMMTYTTNFRNGAWKGKDNEKPKLFARLWEDFLALRRTIAELHGHLSTECADRAQQYMAKYGERPNLFGGEHSDRLYGVLWTASGACQMLLNLMEEQEPLDSTFKVNDLTGYL